MTFTQTEIHTLHYQDDGTRNPALNICEKAYESVVRLWLWGYKAGLLPVYRLPVPVISIGNLTTGGTGKTPITIALAQALEAAGLKVAVLSRGYKSARGMRFHEADNHAYGDEAFLIQQHLRQGKVFVGRDRVWVGKKVVTQFRPEVILLDDGYQHLRLHRDINLLLVDGEWGFGNRRLLPAGPLREPLEGMRRADWVLLTKAITPQKHQEIQALMASVGVDSSTPLLACPFYPMALWCPQQQQPYPLTHLAETSVALLCGIAQPATFQAMVVAHTQAIIKQMFVFADHTVYSAQTLAPVHAYLQAHPETALITTEKDWVKLATCLDPVIHARVFVLRIEPQFENNTLIQAIIALCQSNSTVTAQAG